MDNCAPPAAAPPIASFTFAVRAMTVDADASLSSGHHIVS